MLKLIIDLFGFSAVSQCTIKQRHFILKSGKKSLKCKFNSSQQESCALLNTCLSIQLSTCLYLWPMAPVHEFTSNISGCMWPMTGLAPASRIRGGTLDGPGPNMCRCGTASGQSSRCGGGTARDDMFPAARPAEKWSLRRQNRACGGRRTTLRPPTSQLRSSDGVTTLSVNTGPPLNTVGSQASVQVWC